MKPLRVLIADDDGLTLMVLDKILAAMGHEVVGEAADGEHAVELAAQTTPDLCILDIRMPKMEGLEAARRIHRQHPTPIIILSAHSEAGLGSQAAGAGAHAYLVKPFTADQLKPAIELALVTFHNERRLEERLQQANEALESRKLVERAKGILMRETGLDEEAAYLRLQRTARDENRKLSELARVVILADQMRREGAAPSFHRRAHH